MRASVHRGDSGEYACLREGVVIRSRIWLVFLGLALAGAQSGERPGTREDSKAQTSLRGDVDSGRTLYRQFCTPCHGATGQGDGPVGQALNPRPANHTDTAYMGQLSDEHVTKVIRDGAASVGKSPMMAPWGDILSEQDIRDVLGYLRTLSGT